jgi:hypothetical protein
MNMPVRALTTLEQHHANLDQAALDPDITVQQASEIRGEREAAKHMSGEQDMFLCHCSTVDPIKLANRRTETDYENSVCTKCGYEAPGIDEWKMVKGWNGGGTGIDQIWIKPTNWNWEDPDNPPLEAVRIVEAKGGNANLDTDGTYGGAYGPDGVPIGEEGTPQMSEDWVFITCCLAADASHLPSEHRMVAHAVRMFLIGQAPDLEVTGIVIRDGKPLQEHELPEAIHYLLDDEGLFVYEPAGDDREMSLREELNEYITVLGPNSQEVADVCGQILGQVQGTGFNPAYVLKYQQAVNVVAHVLHSKAVLTASEEVLKNHFLNVLAQIDQLIRLIPELIEREFAKIFPDVNVARATPERLAAARVRAQQNAFTQLYKSLNEVSGEIGAAKLMYDRGARMVRGWSGGDTGMDQVWVQCDSNPNFDINQAPWPNDIKIIVVEAKGGSTGLSKGKVYKGVDLSTGVTMVNGCVQMDANWVMHHADVLTTAAETAPLSRYVGQLIQHGITTGVPPIRGIGVKGSTVMGDKDFKHLSTTKVEDGDVTGFTDVKLLKYGP